MILLVAVGILMGKKKQQTIYPIIPITIHQGWKNASQVVPGDKCAWCLLKKEHELYHKPLRVGIPCGEKIEPKIPQKLL